jgi:hypothetical protein
MPATKADFFPIRIAAWKNPFASAGKPDYRSDRA